MEQASSLCACVKDTHTVLFISKSVSLHESVYATPFPDTCFYAFQQGRDNLSVLPCQRRQPSSTAAQQSRGLG
jgi:hypothetical protein